MKFTALLITILLLFAPASAGALEDGMPAPDFTLPDIRPEAPPITLSDFLGQVVYVDFWASWCLPCLRSLPEINTLHQAYRDRGFEVIAITIDYPLQEARDFLDDLETPLDYYIAGDAQADVMDAYGVRGMPTSFLIDRSGVIRKIHEGYRDGDLQRLEDALKPLL